MGTAHGGKGGAIVQISSGSAYIGSPLLYGASKGALNSITIGLVAPLAKQRIRINTVRRFRRPASVAWVTKPVGCEQGRAQFGHHWPGHFAGQTGDPNLYGAPLLSPCKKRRGLQSSSSPIAIEGCGTLRIKRARTSSVHHSPPTPYFPTQRLCGNSMPSRPYRRRFRSQASSGKTDTDTVADDLH
jgi:hypothetical protein